MVVVLFREKMRADADLDAYAALSGRMHELVHEHPGFISIESFETGERESLSVELFESEESVQAWRRHPEHMEAQRRARSEFYESYSVQTGEIVREYGFDHETSLANML